VTYFTTVVETVIAGYIHYLVKQQEYTNTDMKKNLKSWKFDRLSKKKQLDLKNYEKQKNDIERLEIEVNAAKNLKIH